MSIQLLQEKWEPVLNASTEETIKDSTRQRHMAQILENQSNALHESANVTSGLQNWDPILMGLARRVMPKLIAYDFCGVQPMTAPTQVGFALRAHYAGTGYVPNTNPVPFPGAGSTPGTSTGDAGVIKYDGTGTPQGGPEALFNEADSAYSGDTTQAPPSADNPWAAGFNAPGGMATATGESSTWNSMGITIEKFTAVATTRQLRADYSLELAQDMKAQWGLDAESELINILSNELVSELNRQVVRQVYLSSVAGAQWTGITTPGKFDLNADADGRWSVERYKGLLFAIERDANAISLQTRRGKGNVIITSPDVASALALTGILDYAPALADATNLTVDATGTTFAGTIGRFKVFVDPFLATNGYVVGFKGADQYDNGLFYCPYVPLTLVRATNPENFQPAIGFKTRFALIANPYTSAGSALQTGTNVYFRKTQVLNLF